VIAPPTAPQWVFPSETIDRARAFGDQLNAPWPLAQALLNRGVRTAAEAGRFLTPSLDDLHDPAGLLDIEEAATRIMSAIKNGERILVHGDYDVDGITSTYLLYTVLRDLGGLVEFRIPHRTRDGYGLSVAAIDDAKLRGCSLIVTVDCGITALEPVRDAAARGIDVVITDHHEPPAELPAARAIVNPHRAGCPYPFKSLAGVGVTFKLVQALLRGRGGLEPAAEYLDVVALGTIADVVPLLGENRALAGLGLDRLNARPRIGIQALMQVAGLAGQRISSGQIAFVLAPRINAGGRMGNAEQGLRLLLARDRDEALGVAESLEEDNDRRRAIDEQVLIEASRRVVEELRWPDCRSILLWSDRWHPGVIGIVASRLLERFQRPTILVSMNGDRGRGSGRSVAGLDLNRALHRCSDLLVSFGGHAFAAGLSVERSRLPELRTRFEELVAAELDPADIAPRLQIDAELPFRECDVTLASWIERLSPFGLGNTEPVFAATAARIQSTQTVGGGKHLRLQLSDGTATTEAIGFGMGERAREISEAGRCDVAFVPARNEWMGETRVQLKVKAVRLP